MHLRAVVVAAILTHSAALGAAAAPALTTVYSFNCGADGSGPNGTLTVGADGALYGTTAGGGGSLGGDSGGTVFALRPPAIAGKKWRHQILFNFGAEIGNSALLQSSLVFDPSGNLFGTRDVSPAGLLSECTRIFATRYERVAPHSRLRPAGLTAALQTRTLGLTGCAFGGHAPRRPSL